MDFALQAIEELEGNLKQLREELDETDDKSVVLAEEKKKLEVVCDMLNRDLSRKTAEAEATHSALIEARLALQREKGINEQHQVGAMQLQGKFQEQIEILESQLSEASERCKMHENRCEELDQLLMDASEQYANLEERFQDVEKQLQEKVKQCVSVEERCKELETQLLQERATESEDSRHPRHNHNHHNSTIHGHNHNNAHHNSPHHPHHHQQNHHHHPHKSHDPENKPEAHQHKGLDPESKPEPLAAANAPTGIEPNNNPIEQEKLIEQQTAEAGENPGHPTHNHDHASHQTATHAIVAQDTEPGNTQGSGEGPEAADQSDSVALPPSTQPPAPTKPKYISLMSIRSNSGILNVSRQNSQKADSSSSPNRGQLKSAPAPITGGEQQLRGILKPSSASSNEQLSILTPATQFPSTSKVRSLLQRSFNDEESPMPSAHSKHDRAGFASSLQMPADIGRRPHTTGTAHFQEPVSSEVDINMDSSREPERDRTWQPSSPKVKISRKNQDLMLLWEQQQQQQQLSDMQNMNQLLQITVALKDKLARTEQERDRHATQIGFAEKRREASESLCQLKLKESSLLLQELSEQLVAARQQIADMQRQRSDKEEREKREKELATKLVDAEVLLPKIDKSYQIQGKNSFPAGSVKKKLSLAGSKSECRLSKLSTSSPDKPSRSLSPTEKKHDAGITNKARLTYSVNIYRLKLFFNIPFFLPL